MISLIYPALGKVFTDMCLCHQSALTWHWHKLGR